MCGSYITLPLTSGGADVRSAVSSRPHVIHLIAFAVTHAEEPHGTQGGKHVDSSSTRDAQRSKQFLLEQPEPSPAIRIVSSQPDWALTRILVGRKHGHFHYFEELIACCDAVTGAAQRSEGDPRRLNHQLDGDRPFVFRDRCELTGHADSCDGLTAPVQRGSYPAAAARIPRWCAVEPHHNQGTFREVRRRQAEAGRRRDD